MDPGVVGVEADVRGLLLRHPIAVDCASAAGRFGRCPCEVVVFESGRAFVVASTEAEVLQPRHLIPAEARLLQSGDGAALDEGAAAFAISDGTGSTVGSLTLIGVDGMSQPDGFHALARLITTTIAEQAEDARSGSIEAAVLDGLRDAVVILDPNLNVKWVNRATGSLFGRTAADMIGRSAVELLHPDDIDQALDAVTRLREGLEIYRVLVRIERGNGGYERVEVTGVDQTSHPLIAGTVVSLRGAEVAEELEASVERATRMSDAIVAGLHDGIVATDQFGAITMVNDVARRMFGLDADAPPASLNLADFTVLDSEGRAIAHDFGATSTAIDGVESRDVCVVSAHREPLYVTTQRRAVHDRAGEILGSVVAFHDVTDSRRSAEELRSQAMHDQLTGLANRRQLENRIGELASLDTPALVAACFIDLDGFKLVNDTLGHRSGDKLIRIAAKRLQAKLRESDLLIRQGGDEFVALLVDMSGPDEALAAAERLRQTLSRPYTLGQDRFDLTASIGVALSQAHNLTDETLLRYADTALYAAKARGRNRVELFDIELATAVKLEERQRRMLRDALENDRLVMHFQPLVETETGETAGYEALARCRDDHGQLVGPDGFMDSIAQSGLMWDLDQAAFALSCQAAAVLAKVTPDQPPIISCNFSAISLVQPGLVDFIVETVNDNSIEPSQICLEITESAAFEAGPSSLEALRSLHRQGFLLALDDFGTGYSSLAHLRDLPLSTVKVDRSFITRLSRRSSERAIAEAIVSLATDLGLGVVAEGVETSEQLHHARQLGFNTIQGWHFSPALALTDILTDWLQHNDHVDRSDSG